MNPCCVVIYITAHIVFNAMNTSYCQLWQVTVSIPRGSLFVDHGP